MPEKIVKKTINNEAESVNKEGLIKRFEGLNKNTLNVWLMEMRNDSDFHKYVINLTHKLVWININGFLDFLKKKVYERGY